MFSPLLLLLLLLRNTSASSSLEKQVVGYWQASRASSQPPSAIDFSSLTHLNYAFYMPNADGTLRSNQATSYLTEVTQNAHNAGKTVSLAIGGANGSKNLSSVFSSTSTRTALVNECVKYVKVYGLDGIDLDYEFPSNMADTRNSITFMTELRSKLNTIISNRTTTRHPYLTTVLGMNSFVDNNGNLLSSLSSVVKVVDAFNVLSYNYNQPSQNTTAPNSPLYPVQCSSMPAQQSRSLSNSIRAFKSAGVPLNMLNAGAPYYSNLAVAASKPTVGMQCYPAIAASSPQSVPLWYSNSSYTTGSDWESHFDNVTMTGWSYQSKTGYFTSTNWADALQAKADYASCNGLGGMSVWSVDGDLNGQLSAVAASCAKSVSKARCAQLPL